MEFIGSKDDAKEIASKGIIIIDKESPIMQKHILFFEIIQVQ